jgi:UDP-N-acetylmuramate dehydrogenase
MLDTAKIIHDFSLKDYNTFGIDQTAEAFITIEDEKALISLLQNKEYRKKFILGGGSNLLLTKPLKGLCIHLNTKGIRVINEDDTHVIVEAMAGENWHDFVIWSLDQGYGGLENLSLIPGNVGTAPIQNIGAYGVELKDIFHQCTALKIENGKECHFNIEDVDFGYRTSIFKTSSKGKYVITRLQVRLTKNKHLLKTSYGDILAALAEETPSPKNIAKAVIAIRTEKLPNPSLIGNSGSFFKNPIVSYHRYEEIKARFPKVPAYVLDDEHVKIPAGWLIETIGLKGHRQGDAGVHKKQALVLVNYGNASGHEILQLAKMIQIKVAETFSISLEAEVNII